MRSSTNHECPPPSRADWICQIAGWLLYGGFNAAVFAVALPGNAAISAANILSNCALGAFYAHRYRRLIHQRGWLRLPLLSLLPRAARLN
jgi:hypothetical protein